MNLGSQSASGGLAERRPAARFYATAINWPAIEATRLGILFRADVLRYGGETRTDRRRPQMISRIQGAF